MNNSNGTIKWIIGLLVAGLISIISITINVVNKTKFDTLSDIKQLAEEARDQSYENKLSITALQAQMVMILSSQADVKTELKELNNMHRGK